MKNHFCFSLFTVGTAAWLVLMLFMLMTMPSSVDGYEVFVMPMDENMTKKTGDFITFELEKRQITATDLKKKIAQKIGIPPERQTLRKQTLYDDSHNNDDSFYDGSSYFLSLDEFEIAVWYKGSKYTIWVKQTDTVTVLKKKIQRIIGFVPARQTLYKFNLANQKIAMKNKKNSEKLKEKLKDGIKLAIEETHQQQEFRKIEEAMANVEGTVLDEEDGNKTMAQYGIVEEENIYVSVDGFDILVQYAEEIIVKKDNRDHFEWKLNSYTLRVKSTDTVATLKKKIQEKVFSLHSSYTISAYQLTVRRDSHYGIVLEDNKTMKDYGIVRHGAVYASSFEFEIYVWYNGKPYTIDVRESNSVETLKQRIQSVISITPERQTLRHKNPCNVALEAGRTLLSYSIKQTTSIFLALDELKINVIFISEKQSKPGNTYNVWVKGTDTVAILKKKIYAALTMGYIFLIKYDFISDHECLTAGGDENVKTMEQCGVKEGHTFKVKKKSDHICCSRQKNSQERQCQKVMNLDFRPRC